jgi:hypothetical protein
MLNPKANILRSSDRARAFGPGYLEVVSIDKEYF